uniref:Uncharacterized protein n=1 Tax=Oryza brachyantha TaxID=4533 RepID=J3N881_ORYBR
MVWFADSRAMKSLEAHRLLQSDGHRFKAKHVKDMDSSINKEKDVMRLAYARQVADCTYRRKHLRSRYIEVCIGSNDSREKTLFNLKGYIAGNPFTDLQFDGDGKIRFYHGMGLISDEIFENAKETCRGKYITPSNARCSQLVDAINDCVKDINEAHILEPSCGEIGSPRIQTRAARLRTVLQKTATDDDLNGFQCRIASYMVYNIWANHPTVRESLGVHKVLYYIGHVRPSQLS